MRPAGVRVSTPGRICLFGEHQDYLQLPVIAAAISRRVTIEARPRADARVHLARPDLGDEVSFELADPVPYTAARDYLRSSVNVLRRNGFTFSHGVDGVIRGDIPINSGTSSSTALVVSWIGALAALSDAPRRLSPMEAAALAHAAEVQEFQEPGGMMDHYTTACGGVVAIEFQPAVVVTALKPTLAAFVLGDSGEPKDTVAILARVKHRVQRLMKGVAAADRDLAPDDRALIDGTIRNRDITRQARALLAAPSLDSPAFGALLTAHQDVLRDVLRISTPKIDRMLDAALSAGALGGKINGSGGGGCMFAYAPDDPERVAAAIEAAGGRAYIVRVDEGMSIDGGPGLQTGAQRPV
jgi:galactokinase